MFDHNKYLPFRPVGLSDRTWPDQTMSKAPRWCSVDLRDGNQALVNPMSVEKKTRMFELLVRLGFKEIEIGFPSASQPDYNFVRKLIEENRIPDDVTVQVLTQARRELIEKTFQSLTGVKRAIVHLYNSTSTVQREQVFKTSHRGIIDIAAQGANWVRECAMKYPQTDWVFQYSPESFTGTELDHAIDACDSVLKQWRPETGREVIINLPATVEMSTPNVFADQIEYFCRHLKQRDQVTISLHTHNDRGCAVAAAELGIFAGAQRIEGTLLGNGERTGNMDIITMAMNLYSQGIDPRLDLSDIVEIIEIVEDCTDIPIAPRHPWAGELVYTAFSGSHQDAIRKSMQYHKENHQDFWNVAYLPIDPRDINRRYEEVVRINSQSGKGGVALVLERDFGIELPKWMHPQLSNIVQIEVEKSGMEISPENIKSLYEDHFISVAEKWQLGNYQLNNHEDEIEAQFTIDSIIVRGIGTGVLEALCSGLIEHYGQTMEITHYDQHALETGTDAKAMACVEIIVDGKSYSGVAIKTDTPSAAIQATLTAYSRAGINAHQGVA